MHRADFLERSRRLPGREQPNLQDAQFESLRGIASRVLVFSFEAYTSRMLHDFLSANRSELIDLCRSKVSLRLAPKASRSELDYGIPLFLDQLIKTLRVEQTSDPMRSRKVSGPSGGARPVLSEIGESATLHGRELLQHGFTVDQVVHDYGDLCQAITELAFELEAGVDVEEFQTLNRCLDNAIADAVTEFAYQHDALIAEKAVQALNERLGFLAHELRNHVHTATLALTAIRAGNLGVGGATGAVLDRSLIGLRNLIDRSLAEVRVTAGMPSSHKLISLAELISEVKISASLEAQMKHCGFAVSFVDPDLGVKVDRDLLISAVGNLLQNAFKFTRPGTEVSLNAYAAADRVVIDVVDNGDGVPPGQVDRLFHPFVQVGSDKSGLGLGLSICKRSVEANDGTLSVRNTPDSGCVFTINLPRHSLAELPSAA
jgi:signal transduction histidine kinase